MSGVSNNERVLSDKEVIEIANIDRFRPTLKCDLFIPSYIHSLSVATEFIYEYVFSRFPPKYFKSIYVANSNPLEDMRRMNRGDLAVKENPCATLSYSLQYDYNDNNTDWNLLSTNKYLRVSQWQRSFFKYPQKGLYIGMDLEAMLINYNFKFRVNTKAESLDLYNRIRKIFRLGCTETCDLDMDFHIDRNLLGTIAREAGFEVDEKGEIKDSWNFVRFLNAYSQMPILYKLRLINQRYEYFLRMRNMPVHLDFQNPLDVDEGGNQNGMTATDFVIEFQIAVRFPAPRTFALYNEGKWTHRIHTESDTSGVSVYSMKLCDIPELNYQGWPLYGHSNYISDEPKDTIEEIDITELFKAPADVKSDTSLDDIIEDSLNQFISPDSFIEIAVYTNDILAQDLSGRLPITMDWPTRRILLPDNTPDSYFYIAIYIDREYVNNKVVQITGADKNRIMTSINRSDVLQELDLRKAYNHNVATANKSAFRIVKKKFVRKKEES